MNARVMPIREEALPIPEKGWGGNRRYHWKALGISSGEPLKGPSFLVSCPNCEITRLWSSITSCVRNQKSRHGREFILRRVDKGIRIWRTK